MEGYAWVDRDRGFLIMTEMGMSDRSIVQATLWNSPYLGNVMMSELALARAVRERFGISTHFVLADGAAEQPWLADLEAAGSTWSVLPPRGGWRAHLDRVIEEHGGALVHTHFTEADLPAARAAKAVGIPCVWHVRTGFSGYPLKQRVKDLIKMRVVARRDVAAIVAVSPWLAGMLRSRGAPADRVEAIPNAIVMERFDDMPTRAEARERFGLGQDADVVLGLGWWPEVKGVDVLLDALEQIAGRHPELEALLVGEEDMRSFLAERQPPPAPWVHTSGFVDDAAWLYAAADVFVSASRHEGQSSAIGEAIACGLGVVMSDIPGTSGWGAAPHVATFPSEDAAALAGRLDQLLAASPDERVAAGAENVRWSHGTGGIEAWCTQLGDLYERLLAR